MTIRHNEKWISDQSLSDVHDIIRSKLTSLGATFLSVSPHRIEAKTGSQVTVRTKGIFGDAREWPMRFTVDMVETEEGTRVTTLVEDDLRLSVFKAEYKYRPAIESMAQWLKVGVERGTEPYWLASDGQWYPPELHPDAQASTPSASSGDTPPETNAPDSDSHPEGYWLASDGQWYPPELHPDAQAGSSPEQASTYPDAGVPSSRTSTPHTQSMPPQFEDKSLKSKSAAGVMALVFGSLGVHRFYLGHVGIGIVMLGLTVLSLGMLLPLVWVWGIIEGILILTGSIDTDAEGRPLRS